MVVLMKNKKSQKNLIIVTFVILLLSGLIGGLYFFVFREKSEPNGISLAPATEQEKADAEDNKNEIIQQQEKQKNDSANTTDSSGSEVVVTITSANSEGVYSFVSGVLEDGGTCTAIYSKGSESFQKTSSGFINVTDTQCEPITTNRGDFSSTGVWSVQVTYSGSASQARGTSQASKITIQ